MPATRVEGLSGGIGWSGEKGFFEELRVHVRLPTPDDPHGEEKELVLRVPCSKPERADSRASEEDTKRLEALLQAHEEAVAGQRARPNSQELWRTFVPLLSAMRRMEGHRLRRVDLSALHLIEYLDLDWTLQYTNEIPELTRLPEDLRRIAGDVEELLVESSRITTLPEWVGEMENLRFLEVGTSDWTNTLLREIPASIGELRALRELSLINLVNLEELPEGMKRLTGLKDLFITGCGLREVPGWIAEMGGLRELFLESEHVEELPEEFGQLTRLQSLCVAQARLRVLPELMGRLTGLQTLKLKDLNALEEFPASVCRLTGLQQLTIQKCAALGELSDEMGRLTGLHTLQLEGLNALDHLPTSVERLTGLQRLKIAGCGALVELPEEMGRLKGLEELELADLNALDHLPASLGGLTGLQHLMIRQCGALGELPESIGLMKALKSLQVGWTPIRDMPASMEALTALVCLTVFQCGDSSNAYQTLARCLPSMQKLKGLYLIPETEDSRLQIGRCLRAWPPPDLSQGSYFDVGDNTVCKYHSFLRGHWRALGLPAEAAEWRDNEIVEHFRVQQSKVTAFASGLHRRLGAGSMVSQLDEQLLVLVADKVLGGWSLKREWREQEKRRPEDSCLECLE